MRVLHLLAKAMAAVALLTVGLTATASAQANLIASFFVDNFYFSPNGDGVQDATTVSYNLIDSARVDLVILANDSTTIVKALVAGAPTPVGVTNYKVIWDGRDALGAGAPEGSFLVFLRAENATGVDSSFSRIFVDVNRPQASITQVFPSFFVPNAPDTNAPDVVQFAYNVSDPALNDSLFFNAALFDPDGVGVAAPYVDRFVLPPAAFQNIWNGAAAKDGIYELRIEARDRAGNVDQNRAEINVDVRAPNQAAPGYAATGDNVNPPATLMGWAFDRNGLSALEMKFFGSGVWQTIPNTTIRNDTTLFSIAVADSLPGEGRYELRIRATDIAQRVNEVLYTIVIDTTPPNPPTLTNSSQTLRTSKIILTGTGTPGALINAYRNGALASANIAHVISGVYQIDLLLAPGNNTIYVTETDKGANESAPSTTINIVFDVSTGLTIGQPLRPDEPIVVVLPEPARSVRLFIYDLAGDLVEEMVQTQVASNYVFRWNGLNGDQVEVKRGPLVAVIRVEFVDGGRREMIREAFLWDPNS